VKEKVEKIRLDVALVEQGFAPSREKAKALIMSGIVFVDHEKCDKAGEMIKAGTPIEVRGSGLKYVSRGGLKLEKAMELWKFALDGDVCMDIGASTGGFSDCMLQNGAQKVYAIDVGYGQLAWSLRTDQRVINLERTNIRYLTREQVPEAVNFASIDVSFISLTLVLPVLYDFLKDGGKAVCLVKPQFEAGKGKVGKKGVVRDEAVHREVCEKIYDFCVEHGLCVRGMTFSPIKGPEGNIEYLFYLSKTDPSESVPREKTWEIVDESHKALSVSS
jgi:23S rRNA (cytidine1920-2'-O)/16S rRNA (cytidine1409-2'-O)-methyltransferase